MSWRWPSHHAQPSCRALSGEQLQSVPDPAFSLTEEEQLVSFNFDLNLATAIFIAVELNFTVGYIIIIGAFIIYYFAYMVFYFYVYASFII